MSVESTSVETMSVEPMSVESTSVESTSVETMDEMCFEDVADISKHTRSTTRRLDLAKTDSELILKGEQLW